MILMRDKWISWINRIVYGKASINDSIVSSVLQEMIWKYMKQEI